MELQGYTKFVVLVVHFWFEEKKIFPFIVVGPP